jgi:hypothetical protein
MTYQPILDPAAQALADAAVLNALADTHVAPVAIIAGHDHPSSDPPRRVTRSDPFE